MPAGYGCAADFPQRRSHRTFRVPRRRDRQEKNRRSTHRRARTRGCPPRPAPQCARLEHLRQPTAIGESDARHEAGFVRKALERASQRRPLPEIALGQPGRADDLDRARPRRGTGRTRAEDVGEQTSQHAAVNHSSRVPATRPRPSGSYRALRASQLGRILSARRPAAPRRFSLVLSR